MDRCGRQIPYLVSFVRATDGHLGVGILRLEGSEQSVMPGNTLADRTLQRDTFLLLAQKDISAFEGGPCRMRKVKNTEVVSPLDGGQVDGGKPVAGQWAERWTLDRCGASIPYIVRFVTTRTGTTFSTERDTAHAPTAPPTQAVPSADAPAVGPREPAPAAGVTSPPQPAANPPQDAGGAIDWLLKPRGTVEGKK